MGRNTIISDDLSYVTVNDYSSKLFQGNIS